MASLISQCRNLFSELPLCISCVLALIHARLTTSTRPFESLTHILNYNHQYNLLKFFKYNNTRRGIFWLTISSSTGTHFPNRFVTPSWEFVVAPAGYNFTAYTMPLSPVNQFRIRLNWCWLFLNLSMETKKKESKTTKQLSTFIH